MIAIIATTITATAITATAECIRLIQISYLASTQLSPFFRVGDDVYVDVYPRKPILSITHRLC